MNASHVLVSILVMFVFCMFGNFVYYNKTLSLWCLFYSIHVYIVISLFFEGKRIFSRILYVIDSYATKYFPGKSPEKSDGDVFFFLLIPDLQLWSEVLLSMPSRKTLIISIADMQKKRWVKYFMKADCFCNQCCMLVLW